MMDPDALPLFLRGLTYPDEPWRLEPPAPPPRESFVLEVPAGIHRSYARALEAVSPNRVTLHFNDGDDVRCLECDEPVTAVTVTTRVLELTGHGAWWHTPAMLRLSGRVTDPYRFDPCGHEVRRFTTK